MVTKNVILGLKVILTKRLKMCFIFFIITFLVTCVPPICRYIFITLEGDWSDKVIRTGRLNIGGDTLFFTDEINIEYRNELTDFVIQAELLAASMPSIKFRLLNTVGEPQELNISTNHPCYFNKIFRIKLSDDGRPIAPVQEDRTCATHQWVEVNPNSDWVRRYKPDCYQQKVPTYLYITLSSSVNNFELNVPIKVNKKGYFLHFDAV